MGAHLPRRQLEEWPQGEIGVKWSPEVIFLGWVVCFVGAIATVCAYSHVATVSGRYSDQLVLAASLGYCCIWSMHFIGMGAMELEGHHITYDATLTVISLVIPLMACCGVNLCIKPHVTTQMTYDCQRASILVLMIGILGMHLVGMASMSGAFYITYDYRILGGSVLTCFIACLIVVKFAGYCMSLENVPSRLAIFLLSAVLATGVNATHYIGMFAASYHPTEVSTHGVDVDVRFVLTFALVSDLTILLYLREAQNEVLVDARHQKDILQYENSKLVSEFKSSIMGKNLRRVIVHDLKNRLSDILAITELGSPNATQEIASIAMQSLHDAEGLMRLTKAMSNRVTQEDHVQVGDLLHNRAALCSCDERDAWISIDAACTRFIIRNIMDNAIKHGRDAQYSLELGEFLTFRATNTASECLIEGVNLILPMIESAGQKLVTSQSSGSGLFAIKYLTDLLCGNVTMTCQGGIVTLLLELPYQRVAAVTRTEKPAVEQYHNEVRIVAVDDDPIQRLLLQKKLAQSFPRANVILLGDERDIQRPTDTLNAMQALQPDVVIMDYYLGCDERGETVNGVNDFLVPHVERNPHVLAYIRSSAHGYAFPDAGLFTHVPKSPAHLRKMVEDIVARFSNKEQAAEKANAVKDPPDAPIYAAARAPEVPPETEALLPSGASGEYKLSIDVHKDESMLSIV